MLFGKLDQEDFVNEAMEDNLYTQQLKGFQKQNQGKNKFSKMLKMLSHYGMQWDDEVTKNLRAIPSDKSLLSKSGYLEQNDLGFKNPTFASWQSNNQNEKKSYFEKDLKPRLEILRKMAMQPELETILDIMADESIVYDDDETYVCMPYIDSSILQILNEESADEIKNAIETIFYKIYYLADWKERAWADYKKYLIDGVLAYHIIYDDIKNPKQIIGIVPLEAETLTKEIIEGTTYWIQYKGILNQERILLDAEVIYIKYEDSGVSVRQSYLERLIRPFNIYRIIEQAQIIWTVTQASFKTVFTIPVQGMNKAKGMQTLNAAMSRYKEDISFNVDSAELLINGKVNQPFNNEYWFAENQNGKPTLETIVDNGPEINNSEQLRYFKNDLYKQSKIPTNRFDSESQSTWFGSDPTQTLRDEINFSRFVTRVRHEYAKVILKPLRIQLALQIPSLKNDKRILDAIQLRFNTYNQFEELMNIEIDTKRVEFIQTLKTALSDIDEEGNEIPYFCNKFLVEKHLHMSEADLELNEKYKLEAKALLADADEETNAETDMGGEIDQNQQDAMMDIDNQYDMGIPQQQMGGNQQQQEQQPQVMGGDIDSDMLGNVQPEVVV